MGGQGDTRLSSDAGRRIRSAGHGRRAGSYWGTRRTIDVVAGPSPNSAFEALDKVNGLGVGERRRASAAAIVDCGRGSGCCRRHRQTRCPSSARTRAASRRPRPRRLLLLQRLWRRRLPRHPCRRLLWRTRHSGPWRRRGGHSRRPGALVVAVALVIVFLVVVVVVVVGRRRSSRLAAPQPLDTALPANHYAPPAALRGMRGRPPTRARDPSPTLGLGPRRGATCSRQRQRRRPRDPGARRSRGRGGRGFLRDWG